MISNVDEKTNAYLYSLYQVLRRFVNKYVPGIAVMWPNVIIRTVARHDNEWSDRAKMKIKWYYDELAGNEIIGCVKKYIVGYHLQNKMFK